ncbi:ABC transporter substrate-binding protein [Methylobacterium nonmethylotrophicum]|uniref:ABC transporter substrate-binding protein n=1 Tax=Methylobacterium nonmethylotrophicum TaxID=1141884 RepID=A0A4Z0NXM8_9HYPH|nr:ABC transporter substrate-binding protein [Methylobacterium nonmethylotrophicum]TGE02234.1 ABC transporter substrate-binding protein [Methylobacterium nonmethylotrophicum]
MTARWRFDRGGLTAPRATRRDVLAWLAGTAAVPRVAGAQPRKALPVIGYLGLEAPDPYASRLAAFREGLAEAGFVEGRDVAIDFRWAEGRYERLPGLARDLVERRVAVLAAPGGAPVALAAKAATATIPIVFEMGGDPVALGVVQDLARPRGNVTGVSSLSVEVSRKRLEFLHEAVPAAAAFAVAFNPTSPTAPSQLRSLHEAAEALGVQIRASPVASEADFAPIVEAAAARRPGGLVFTSDPYFALRSRLLAALAIRHAVPAVTQTRDFPLAGGLMSYGGDFTQTHRLAGLYAGRILKGERPSDLPVQLVTKVELFVNLKAADALGVIVPPALLSAADTVLE